MTPEHAFLHAIKAEPEDDNLRLIFADWLEDNGQPDRAEFVRLQVQRIRLARGDPHHIEMKRREVSLLRAHAQEWLGPLAGHRAVRCWDFRRGLLWLNADANQYGDGALLGDCAKGHEALAWIDTLKATSLLRQIAKLIESPLLPFLTGLELPCYLGAEEAAVLAGCAHLRNLTALDLASNTIGRQGAEALACSPHLANLAALGLAGNDIGNKGTRALAESAHRNNLTRLDLTNNDIGPGGATALAASARLAHLTWLNLGHNRIGAEGAMALARSPFLTNLTFLYLWGNNIGPAAAEALRQRFGDRVCL